MPHHHLTLALLGANRHKADGRQSMIREKSPSGLIRGQTRFFDQDTLSIGEYRGRSPIARVMLEGWRVPANAGVGAFSCGWLAACGRACLGAWTR
ncbi:hypothetical protein CHELA17_60399 [Chelatococcus asaccharovorans]|nr:hypothetical protein CHELA17_60399 [Chelatococcus asaccharovorans]